MLKALLGQPGEQHQQHSSRAHAGRHQTQPSPPHQNFGTAKESSILCAGRQRLHQVPGMINMEFVIALTISSCSNKRAAVRLTDSNSEKKIKKKLTKASFRYLCEPGDSRTIPITGTGEVETAFSMRLSYHPPGRLVTENRENQQVPCKPKHSHFHIPSCCNNKN